MSYQADSPLYQELAESHRPDDLDPSEVLAGLKSLTDSERKVYKLLEEHPMTPQELRNHSDMPDRTRREALRKLRQIEAVYTIPNFKDGRKDIYHVTLEEEEIDDSEDL